MSTTQMPDPITMGEWERTQGVRRFCRDVRLSLTMTAEDSRAVADRLRGLVRAIWTDERIEQWRREIRGEAFWMGMAST